jgi:hypothetical protein
VRFHDHLMLQAVDSLAVDLRQSAKPLDTSEVAVGCRNRLQISFGTFNKLNRALWRSTRRNDNSVWLGRIAGPLERSLQRFDEPIDKVAVLASHEPFHTGHLSFHLGRCIRLRHSGHTFGDPNRGA